MLSRAASVLLTPILPRYGPIFHVSPTPSIYSTIVLHPSSCVLRLFLLSFPSSLPVFFVFSACVSRLLFLLFVMFLPNYVRQDSK